MTTDDIMALADQYTLLVDRYGFRSASAAKQSIALRAAIEQALNTCGSGAGCLYKEARIEVLEQELGQGEPVAAQHRFRHPEKGTPDWSVWQPCKINNKRPAHEIDSQGYQVEYRALYTAPQPRRRLTDEEIDNTTRKQVDDLLDHIYEYGTAAEGIDFRVRAIARAIEAAVRGMENEYPNSNRPPTF